MLPQESSEVHRRLGSVTHNLWASRGFSGCHPGRGRTHGNARRDLARPGRGARRGPILATSGTHHPYRRERDVSGAGLCAACHIESAGPYISGHNASQVTMVPVVRTVLAAIQVQKLSPKRWENDSAEQTPRRQPRSPKPAACARCSKGFEAIVPRTRPWRSVSATWPSHHGVPLLL